MNEQDVEILLKPINAELVSIQLTQIPKIRAELQAVLEALKKIPPQNNYGSEIAQLKTEIENLKLLVQPMADINARLKKLEQSHSSLQPTTTISSQGPVQSNWFKKHFRKV